MFKYYQLLNQCLCNLRLGNLRMVDQLQVEVQLYRLKHLFLVSEGGELNISPDLDQLVAALVEKVRHLSSPACKAREIEENISHLKEMGEQLTGMVDQFVDQMVNVQQDSGCPEIPAELAASPQTEPFSDGVEYQVDLALVSSKRRN